VVVRGSWGSGPGQFGRRRDPEAAQEAPMAVAAAGDELTVVDQVNRRMLRWKGGQALPPIALGGDQAQDLARAPGGRTLALDRLAEKNVQIYGPDGQRVNELPLAGPGIAREGLVTGVFADDHGIYVEREHGALLRIADASGNADPERPLLAGRPSRDGRLLLRAELEDGEGRVRVDAFDRSTGARRWSAPLAFGAFILQILMLDSDPEGRVYLAADVGREGELPPYPILDETVAVVRLDAAGAFDGRIDLPASATGDEMLRPLAVDDGGDVLALAPSEDGLAVMRYSFP
jgi:hypothetical protein